MSNIVLKKGKEGSLAWNQGEIVQQKAIQTEVVDSCGAGDAFNAGFIYSHLQQLPLKQAMEMATHTASFVIQSYSDNENLPTLEELEKKIKNIKDIDR